MKKDIKLFIATPAYGHTVNTCYMNSILKFVKAAQNHETLNISVSMHLQPGIALITQARNNCVSNFLNSDCTHMLFIDSDIGFEPEAIFRLINKDVPLCLTPYPVKGYGKNNELQFIMHFKKEETIRIEEDGFIEVEAGPTGFMMMKRELFDTLIEMYPNKKTFNRQLIDAEITSMDKNWYTFFECTQDPDSGYLGEDISFCKLWTKINGKIYADIKTSLIHFGAHVFEGSLENALSKWERL